MLYLILIIIIILFLSYVIYYFANKKNNNENLSENDISYNTEELYDKINDEIYKEKIRSYVEKMTLNELMQLLPDEIFSNTPKKRNLLNEALINEIYKGNVNVKISERHYYVDSDKTLENDKDYYYEGISERQNNIKKFEPIVKQNNGISINMDIFSNVSFDDINEKEEIKENKKVISDEIKSLEEKIKFAITLEPIKKNATTFSALLNEYNNLSIDEKVKISRKYTSKLEALKNKTERL